MCGFLCQYKFSVPWEDIENQDHYVIYIYIYLVFQETTQLSFNMVAFTGSGQVI